MQITDIKDQDSGQTMKEVNQDLKNTRRSVAELIKYRVALLDANENGSGKTDTKTIDEYKEKAIDAINHLFDEDLNPEH